MCFSPRLGLFVQLLDVDLELLSIDSPYSAAPDLDGGELAGPDQCVDLRDAHAQISGDVVEREEAGLDLGTRLFGRRLPWHGARITADNDGYMVLALFATV